MFHMFLYVLQGPIRLLVLFEQGLGLPGAVLFIQATGRLE